jgi:uncharacterized membrane protein
MNATIGIYDDHELAVDAVRQLKEGHFPVAQLSIIGKAETEEIDEEMHIMPKNPIQTTSLGVGTVVGTALGILTGVGIFAIPGLGALYGAGALVGAIAGFDLGIIGGGVATILATVGVKDENAKKYHEALEEGKFVVVAHGTQEEVNRALEIMDDHGKHDDIELH